jgi:hypothetical protein
MTSNIEPIAREITRSICRDSEMPETKIDHWVNLHWQCAAAMLEVGVMDETGEWIEGKDWRQRQFLREHRQRLQSCVLLHKWPRLASIKLSVESRRGSSRAQAPPRVRVLERLAKVTHAPIPP